MISAARVLAMNEGSGSGAGASYQDDASPFQHQARRPLLQRLVPVTENLRRYRGGTLRRDLLAGVTVAALALPSSLAYAEIAGLSPVIGLYALLLPAVAYALFGSSRQVIVGPDGSIAALVGAAIIPLAATPEQRAPLAALLAILVGAVFLGAWLGRLGWIADYFSRPVLIGYIHGIAVVLIVGQVGKLLGLSISGQTPPTPDTRGGSRDQRSQLDNPCCGNGMPCGPAIAWLAISEVPWSAHCGRAGHSRIGGRRAGQYGGCRGGLYPGRLAQHRSARLSVQRCPHPPTGRGGHFHCRVLQRDPHRPVGGRQPWSARARKHRNWLPWAR